MTTEPSVFCMKIGDLVRILQRYPADARLQAGDGYNSFADVLSVQTRATPTGARYALVLAPRVDAEGFGG